MVVTLYREIVETLQWEKEMTYRTTAMETLRNPVSRRRLLVGMSAGPFSCIAGNIIASYYFGSELGTAGITNSNQKLKAVCTGLGYESKIKSSLY